MIEQAIILCGGRGTRLRPLTDTIPKVLAPVAGRPFIFHLFDQLYDQDIKRIVLCTGYLGGLIEKRCRNSYRRMAISYSWSDPDHETGERLRHALPSLDDRFLLLYGDTISPQFSKRIAKNINDFSETAITLGVSGERPGNVYVGADERAHYYLTPASAVSSVDRGYMIVRRDRLGDIPDRLENLLERLGREGELSAFPVGPTFTIDDPDLLAKTARALA